MKNKIELLAPAGDFECLTAAINAGCDAVYLGLEDFNMRARAKNFKLFDLPKISKICKENKKKNNKRIKLYLTLNTIIYDSELKKIENIIKKTKKYVDAIICSDISVMLLCSKYKIPFHISTQCSVSNSKTAEFYKKLGAKRIVLARELNLKQIKKISKIIPVEIFIHGAMCISISGRCLTSQFLFNESANRGKCIHPCRRFYYVRNAPENSISDHSKKVKCNELSYYIKDKEGNELKLENNYVLSAKDLCTLPFIEKLKKAGITAFKIEGRNKEPEYVSSVVQVYRRALDKKLTKNEIEKSLKELNKVYNKGFSSGFYLKMPTSDDLSKSEDSSASQSKQFIAKIKHYYPKINVGLLKLNTGSLKTGDEIIIIGKTTGVLKHKIISMQINHKPIEKAVKGDEIGIKLPFCRKNDELYKIVKKDNQ